MPRRRMIIYFGGLALFVLVTVGAPENLVSQVNVYVQSKSAVPEENIALDIAISNVMDLKIISYQFSLNYDDSILEATGVSSSGTLTQSWGDPANNTNTPNKVIAGGYNATEIAGDGVLVRVNFHVVGEVGDIAHLSFDYFTVNDGSITAMHSGGDVSVVEGYAQKVTDLSIAVELQTSVRLDWSETQYATSYNIYRGTTPFFDAITPVANTMNAFFIDANRAGDPAVNYYYAVSAVNSYSESDISNRVGEFDYGLITTTTTDFNEIALPMNISGISTASDLLAAIPGCNSVARWDAEFQGYEQYVSFIPPTNFDVNPGYPYYVNVTDSSVFTLAGPYTSPVFDLIITSTTDFNEIMLPLDRGDLTTASMLLADIPNCNSVARWNAEFQGYEQYVSFIPPTNFAVSIGYPYYVNMTANTIWPSGLEGMPKKNSAGNGKVESGNVFGNSAPHLVFGKIQDESGLNYSDLSLKSYMADREQELLTEMSPGCSISPDLWFWIQCASFPTSWESGDKIRIEIYKKDVTNLWKEFAATLTDNPADEASENQTSNVDGSSLPEGFDTLINYPNPFNSNTTITYHLPQSGHVVLNIYNSNGQRIRSLIDEEKCAGQHQILWHGISDTGAEVSSGIYMIQLIIGDVAITNKMLLMK